MAAYNELTYAEMTDLMWSKAKTIRRVRLSKYSTNNAGLVDLATDIIALVEAAQAKSEQGQAE